LSTAPATPLQAFWIRTHLTRRQLFTAAGRSRRLAAAAEQALQGTPQPTLLDAEVLLQAVVLLLCQTLIA
jgi:hypothetical protein